MRHTLQYLLPLLSVSSAAPLQERATATAGQLTQFELFSEYAGAAYCYDNVQSTTTKLSCTTGGGSCPSIEGVNIALGFSNIGTTKTRGYVATDSTNSLIVVSIQGTQPLTNFESILTDLNITPVKTALCRTANTKDGCRVHQGFLNAAQDVQSMVTAAVTKAVAANPTYKIVSTGHSLGAAVAALLGVMLRNDGHTVDIYTFGQPHLGLVDINTYVQSQSPTQGVNYRVTHAADLVPQVPPHALGGWDHYYPEYWITKVNGMPATVDIAQVTGSLYVTSGNEGDPATFLEILEGVPQHRYYLGAITSCVSM